MAPCSGFHFMHTEPEKWSDTVCKVSSLAEGAAIAQQTHLGGAQC